MVENEIQYLSWDKFRRMAPAIIRLERRRVEGLLTELGGTPDLHNTLVRVRYELKQFGEQLGRGDRQSLESECGSHLRKAILLLSTIDRRVDDETLEILDYVGDRLNYVHDRMVLLY